MLLSSLALLLAPVFVAAVPDCLPSGDERQINDALQQGGKNVVVSLCPGSVHKLNDTIRFTAARQTLTTLGDPTGFERAMLIVEGKDLSTAIQADCELCSHASIHSLIIDGNRPLLLRYNPPGKNLVQAGAALVELGNGEGQSVKHCKITEPRGWSALHFREGDRKQCKRAYVGYNEIGPCGEEWDHEYDGDERSPGNWGYPFADGISLACKDSLIEHNIVYDTTDAAIVLFGSAGTEVKENDIYSRTRTVLGGINLADYDPWSGDYTNVQIHHNRIHAHGRFFKTGIAIGRSTWTDEIDKTLKGVGSMIVDNILDGKFFSYGIVVANAEGFVVERNVILEGSEFGGVVGPTCPKAPENHGPTGMLMNKGSTKGTFQEEFVNGEVQRIICRMPEESNGRPYKPFRFRDSPEYLAAKAKGDNTPPEGFDSRLAEALIVYQTSLSSSLGDITNLLTNHTTKTAAYQRNTKSKKKQSKKVGVIPPPGGNGPTKAELERLIKRIESVELGDRKMRAAVDGIREDLGIMTENIRKHTDERKPLLELVDNAVNLLASQSGFRWHNQFTSILPGGTSSQPNWLFWGSTVIAIWLFVYFVMRRWRLSSTRKGEKIF